MILTEIVFKQDHGHDLISWLIEQCRVNFDINEYTYEKCNRIFYCYLISNLCPHCEHEDSEEVMSGGDIVTEVIVVDLDRKTMEFEVYG
jgi:hypothetical protein